MRTTIFFFDRTRVTLCTLQCILFPFVYSNYGTIVKLWYLQLSEPVQCFSRKQIKRQARTRDGKLWELLKAISQCSPRGLRECDCIDFAAGLEIRTRSWAYDPHTELPREGKERLFRFNKVWSREFVPRETPGERGQNSLQLDDIYGQCII